MAHAFELSHAAYARKDGAGAKELSNEGKAHQREMERLNAEASAWIFRGELLFVFVWSFRLYSLVLTDSCHAAVIRREQSCMGVFSPWPDDPLDDVVGQRAFRTATWGKLIYMDSTSRRLSRTLTKALLKHGREAIRSFASSSVCTAPLFGRGTTDLLYRCTGKGIHSPNHAAKLKPAIEELMQK